jgi:hypothetical protein
MAVSLAGRLFGLALADQITLELGERANTWTRNGQSGNESRRDELGD